MFEETELINTNECQAAVVIGFSSWALILGRVAWPSPFSIFLPLSAIAAADTIGTTRMATAMVHHSKSAMPSLLYGGLSNLHYPPCPLFDNTVLFAIDCDNIMLI